MSENPVKQAVARCRDLGLRRTKALEELLATLLEGDRPMTLAELATSKRLTDQCDKATVYRLLQRLCEHGIIRRLGRPYTRRLDEPFLNRIPRMRGRRGLRSLRRLGRPVSLGVDLRRRRAGLSAGS
jgi:hypothetical protein